MYYPNWLDMFNMSKQKLTNDNLNAVFPKCI